jgi:hypothetical protein
VLMSQQADSHMLDASGVESYNRLEFTHCREYSVQSDIRFDPEIPEPPQASPQGSPPIPSSTDAAPQAIPALLKVTVQLTTSISDKDTVGSLIEGKVLDDALQRGKVLVPNNSGVRGRIRRLDRYHGGGAFIVGLEFTEVHVREGLLPFYADLLRADRNPRIQPTLSERVFVRDRSGVNSREETITLPELPGVASFFIKGTTFTIPSGFRTIWRTRGPIRQH